MRINAISFGTGPVKNLPFNHEELEQRALKDLNEHYLKTGDRSPAIVDYYPNGTYKIRYAKQKRNIFQIIKSLFKK